MSVAGLKKQFYKASQVSGGRSGGIEPRAPGPRLPGVGSRPGPTLAREGAAGTEGAALARVPRWVGRAPEGRGCLRSGPGPARHVGSGIPQKGGQTPWERQRCARRLTRGRAPSPPSLPCKRAGSGERAGEETLLRLSTQDSCQRAQGQGDLASGVVL